MAFKLLEAKGEVDTYYLQKAGNEDEFVTWKDGGFFLRVIEEGNGYEKIPIRFTQIAGSNDTYTIFDALPGH